MRKPTRKLALLLALTLLAAGLGALLPSPAAAQEPFIGEIRMFAGNFAPRGWALCDGQILQIVQNTALFSILGTTYGGDGQTTFGLPDLRGRFPIGQGQGPGLSSRQIGEMAGAEAVTLTTAQMPAHTHVARAKGAAGTTSAPGNNVAAAGRNLYSTAAPDVALSVAAIAATGGSQTHENMPPYLGITFIIALEGIYPPRN